MSNWNPTDKMDDVSRPQSETVVLGVVGVDSGQLLLCDPDYLDGDEARWFREELATQSRACCMASDRAGQLRYTIGHAGLGLVLASGYGNGLYTVEATIWTTARGTRYIKSISLTFIEEQ